jgi:hypothetical protein
MVVVRQWYGANFALSHKRKYTDSWAFLSPIFLVEFVSFLYFLTKPTK